MISFEEIRSGILEIPELSLAPGITAVVGDNGAGKTTFLRICAGLSLPKTGTVSIDGKNPRECEVGYVSEFPDRHMIFSVVRDEIASPLRFAGKSSDEIFESVLAVAEILNITHLLNRECKTLSGGEKMLIGVATALVAKPVLLVMDEPDSHLDPQTSAELFTIIRESDCPHVLWSTHAKKIIQRADQTLELVQGRVSEP
ncbi:ABC transporter ATP-binding protein [Methanorbis furvi]|uniref:Tungstate uptake system ATP-binding protein TupC n=1 Tax=Methanorbis furvi TaxID=3028299 RepID=A0AAE4MAL0_9EURY|nr:Tungstate uptake system ATP-binding protein TupC [Methanocorpusculaceae archaeon Ag1]